MPVIPALSRLRQEDPEFEASLGCIYGETLSKKKNKAVVLNSLSAEASTVAEEQRRGERYAPKTQMNTVLLSHHLHRR
jgi:hypothetical protein